MLDPNTEKWTFLPKLPCDDEIKKLSFAFPCEAIEDSHRNFVAHHNWKHAFACLMLLLTIGPETLLLKGFLMHVCSLVAIQLFLEIVCIGTRSLVASFTPTTGKQASRSQGDLEA